MSQVELRQIQLNKILKLLLFCFKMGFKLETADYMYYFVENWSISNTNVNEIRTL